MGTVNFILVLSALPYVSDAISCLVMRPGYGLVTESCPSSTVGCRIKARSDHVEWYEWSKLYDRNQLVCVYPGEYEGTAGCVRKPSGNIRCWCGGVDDCNDPETSKQLVEAFRKSDRAKIDFIAEKLELGEKVPPETTTTTTTHPTRPPNIRKIVHHKKPTVHKMPKTTRRTTTSTTTTTTTRPSTTKTTAHPNGIEQEFPLPTEMEAEFGMSFDETRRKLDEEMRQEDERLQQLLADEEAEMNRDEEEDAQQREEEIRKERERNRMERRERARADERRRQTEEQTLRNQGRAQKHRETLESVEDDEEDHNGSRSQSNTLSISLISSICSLLLLLLRY